MEPAEPKCPNAVVELNETDSHPPIDILAMRKASTPLRDNRQAGNGTVDRKGNVDRRALQREVVVTWEREPGPAGCWKGHAYLRSHVANLNVINADDDLSDFQGDVSFPVKGPELGFRGHDVDVLKAQVESYARKALVEQLMYWEPLPWWDACP